MSFQVTASDDGELYQLEAIGEVLLPELHVELRRALAKRARHVLIDLRHGRWDTDTVEITMFVNFLEGTLLPNLDKCTGRLVVLMHTIERDKEPENYQVFKELLRIEQENGHFELVDDIESALQLFAKQTAHELGQRSSSVVQPMAAYA